MAAAERAIAVFIGANHSGSASASEALTEAVGSDRCVSLEDYPATLSEASPSLKQQIEASCRVIAERPIIPKFVYTHRPLPIHLGLGGCQVRYLTMLRDPVQRFISYYHWAALHRAKDIPWVAPAIEEGATLAEYVDHVAATGQYPGGLSPAEYYLRAWQALGLVPDALMNSVFGAMFILDKYFAVVGVTEFFDETLFIIAAQLGLSALPRWRMRGKSGAPPAAHIAADVRAKIGALTQTDRALYAYFRERFLDRHRREIEIFRANGLSLRVEGDEDRVGALA